MLKRESSLNSIGSDGNTSFLRAARAGHLDKVLEHLKSNIDINTSNANGLNALHLASKDGHVDVVAELLKRGAVVDAATKKGNTALHIASLAGQEEVVKLLVQHGASVNVQSQNGFTPLYMAAQENHDNVVKYLLANGANQSLATEDGFTPLAVAMQQGHDKVVTVLLENDTRGKVRLPALHIAAKKDDVKAAKLLLENEHNPDVTSKSGFTPLHIASHYGNEAIANLLIHKGADVNYAAKHNITPLHVAAKWGKNNMVALLLEHGANIESKTRDGLTPLHCAARSGHEQVVDMLLERGAPISCKTKNGLAPLHMAAQGDHVDAARILLYHRAPVDEVTVDYLTALHVAAHCGHVRVAKLLLDRQADANARALNGFTPLHIACKKNRIKVVELLLKHGASIGATTESGLTPLHVASFMGCMNIVIYLLQHDANPDVPTVRGETPLHLAARANQTDIIRILLRNGAQVDARAREQQTPLHIASRLGNVDIVMLLLQHGAKVDTTTKDMYTALHIAAKEGQDEVAAVLIENGASLNSTTKKGFTPLHLAAKYGNIKVAKLLLQKEAPVDAQGKNGVTPLHVASHYDHQNVALLLLDKGASPHAIAKNGHTPLHIAARKNQMDIANTLLEYGAKPNAESKAGFTPLHLSAQEGHTDMSSLLIEHEANTNHPAKNGLTPLHLCAQEDRVPVAEILVKNGAQVDAATKSGFTPLHIASHYGQTNMVKFLLANGADVGAQTSLHYTPLHQAAQQGHTNIVNILLENSAHPNSVTLHGQTPLHIAQKLGYISVIETLKVVTETTTTTITMTIEEKYKVVAPEAMQETFMSDSEEEGGEDTVLGDHSYRYLTADEMKSLGDDSLPIDVTRDERIDSNKMVTSEEQNALPPQAIEDGMSPQYITENYVEYTRKYSPDNVDIARHPINIGFLVSFLVDARGGAMRGCRHSGVRVIVPPRCAPSPTRITCRYVRPQRTPHPPPLMEGEALASRVLELGPVGAKFLGPVIIEVPHFAALRGKEREIVILRSDNGETWREHTVEASEDILNEVLNDSFEAEDLNQLEDISSGRITRVITHDFPQYFAIVTRIRQEVHAIGPEGGMVSSTVVPQVQAVFPQGALTKKIKVGLQAQPIDPELAAKLLGHGVAVSPVVTVEPRRRKFHKAITLSMPAPRAHSQGMINQYSGNAPTLRLLCSITGGTTRAQWEDVTGSTPLTFVNDCVSFTTTVSARFWLMDCRNIGDATKMATELYKEAIHVPFMAKFVVFAKRIDPLEARLRVFCMTDDKEDKTLEHQEHFTEVAKSRDVEVLEGKPQYIEFAGNLVPITKSGEPLQFSFRAFRENRLPFSVRVKDQHAEAVGRCLFMREPKVAKGEPPQQPICILNIVLPDDIVTETVALTDNETLKRHMFLKDNFEYYRPDPRLADMSNLLGEDWVPLATQLGLTPSEINVIKSEYPDSVAKQAQSMLRMWISQSSNKAQGDALENALMRIGREDIIPQCLNVDDEDRIPRIPKEVMYRYQKDIDTALETTPVIQKETYESKYSAEEKVVEEPSDEEDFNKSVSERRQQIEKRLTERSIPASAQRQEIVEEITSIKRQSIVEDKLAEAEVKHKPDQPKTTTIIKTVTTDVPETKKMIAETVETIKTTTTSDYQPDEVTIKKQFMEEEQPDRKTTIRTIITEKRTTEHIPSNEIPLHTDIIIDRRDSDLLEGVTQILETTTKPTPRISAMDDPNSPKFSKTPPPSPADFIFKEQAAAIQGWSAPDGESKDKPTAAVTKPGAPMQGIPTSTAKHLASSEELSLDSPKLEKSLTNENDLDTIAQKTNAFIDIESRREPDNELQTVSRESRLQTQNEKTKTLSRDSSREDTSRGDDKKSKKGFFGTLKSIVGKSQDRSDSESEKSQKKEKKKEKRREKKKKIKLPHEKPPLEPPERPPRKPKLPTPPPVPNERPEFKNIPYVEASPTDHMNGISDDHGLQITDLDSMNDIPEHVKSVANNLVSDVITTSETKAQDILDKSPTGKQIVIKEEIQKKIQPKIYDAGDFRIIISPTTESKSRDFFKADIGEKQIDKQISKTSEKIATGDIAEVPVRPQRRKDHIYEDIGEPALPPLKLVFYDGELTPDVKMLTTQLIQNEINFAGWADDRFNIYKPSDIKDKAHTLPKTSKKHGKLFGFLAKKSSKDVDESDNEKDSGKEIIEKQDREPSKERTIKVDDLSDEEGVEHKKGGFFGIFGKKSKKEDDHKDDKEITDKKETEIRTSAAISHATKEKSPEKRQVETKTVDVKETTIKTDKEHITAPTERTDASSEPKPKSRKKAKKEKVLSESEDESEHKKSGLFGLFGKKGKKEESPKEIQLSETVLKDMSNTNDFLQNEIKYFDDVKIICLKPKEDILPVNVEEVKLEASAKDTAIKVKPEEIDKSLITTREKEKTPTRTKKKKERQEKRESSVSEDESEGRKSGIFGLFGKKPKKDKTREKSPKIPDEIKISEEIRKQMTDTNNFLQKEVELFDDVIPVGGFAPPIAVEPMIIKEEVTLKDIRRKTPERMISKDTKVEHILIKETAKLDPITKEEVLTSSTEIIRESITTQSIVKEPKIIKETKAAPVEEQQRLVKETRILSVDGKPVEIMQKTFEEPIAQEDLDNKITTTDFLRGEIDRFDDVKMIVEEPLIIKEQIQTKDKQKLIGEEKITSLVDKKSSKKAKPDIESDSDSDSTKKGGFFGLFGKKTKKEDIKDKKEEKAVPAEIALTEEAKQNLSNCDQFLRSEVLNYEDVAPVAPEIEEKCERIIVERQIPKLVMQETKKDVFITQQPETSLKSDIKEAPQIEAKTDKESVLKIDKKKEKKGKMETQSQESLEKEKKGFFDLFSKKGKKDDKIKQEQPLIKEYKLSDEVLHSMKISNEFLNNEVSNFDDVRPFVVKIEEKVEKDIVHEPIIKTEVRKSEKIENGIRKSAEEATLSKMLADDFLRDEITHFDDVKTIRTSKELKPESTEEIKKQEHQTSDKKKTKKEKSEPDESDSQKKGGFFGLFGKKSKKEEKQPEKPGPSPEMIKNVNDCNQFLTNEVTLFEDVRPIIKKEVSEPIIKTEVKKVEVKTLKSLSQSEADKVKIEQTANFLKDSVEKFDDARQILPKPVTGDQIKPTHIIKETIIIRGDVPDKDIQKILDDNDQIRGDVTLKQVVLDDRKKEEPTVIDSIEEQEEQKAGFFGLFRKKPKKDEKQQETMEDPEETARKIANYNEFLTGEINLFDDVRPIIKEPVIDAPSHKVKDKKQETKASDIDSKLNELQTTDFLKTEIDKFDDVKQILPKSPEKETPKIKPTHLIKETIIIQGDVPDEDIKRILDESDQIKEGIIVTKKAPLDKIGQKDESIVQKSIEKQEQKSKGGFLGLFGKKSKKDEKTEEKSSEEALKNAQDCNQFLVNEIIAFEDVRPIVKKEIIEKPLVKTEKSITELQKVPDQDEESRQRIVQTTDFLKDEIEQFHDVKQLLPKSPDKEKFHLKPTHVIKETIIVRGDLPDEDIRKILDESDQVKEDVLFKQETTPDKDKSKDEAKIDVEESDEKKKGGFFGLFSKKPKKDEKQMEEIPSEEALQAIQNCDQFLTNEIILFEDVRPIIKKEIVEIPDVKREIKESKKEKLPDQSEDSKLKMLETADFLKDEIERFDDVKQLPKSPEDAKSVKTKPTHLIKETIVIRGDLPDEEIKKILDENDQISEDILIKKEATLTKKKLKEESKADVEELDEKKKGGFFGLFSKKTKKDEQVEEKSSEENLQAIRNCNQFLTNEISLFEDVRPKKEIIEIPDVKREIKEVKKSIGGLSDQGEDSVIKMMQTSDFLNTEVEKFDDVKQRIPRSSENVESLKPKATHLIKETIIIRGDVPDEDIKKILDESDQVKEDILIKKETTLDERKPKDEELDEKMKAGFFGLFSKKPKKDEKQDEEKSSEEILQAIQNSDQFLTNEVALFDDVRPVIPKQIVEVKESKKETTEKLPDQSEGSEMKKIQSADFLKNEVEKFDDVKQKLPKSQEKVESVKPKATHLIKETIIIRGDVADEDIKKILDESDQVKEDILIKKETTLDERKPKDEELDEKKKGIFFGLFSKKPKKDEKQDEEKSSEEILQAIQNSEFLTNEVALFDDVRPVIPKKIVEVKESKKETTEKLPDQSEDSEMKKIQSADFLKNEVEKFDDVKQKLPKSPEKVESVKPKATHLIKETIIIRGDLPDEDIKKILDESEQVKEDILIKKEATLDRKKPKDKSKENVEELEEKNKGGFFGLFTKKPKKDKKQAEEDLLEETRQTIQTCDQFLSNEVTLFEDVRPIIKKEVIEIPDTKIQVKESQKETITLLDPTEEAEIKIMQTAGFLKNEVEKFHDVKEILPKSPEKDESLLPKTAHLIKETETIGKDFPEVKPLDKSEQVKKDSLLKQETAPDRKKAKDESKISTEESDEKKKGGFFGLFSKKPKKEEKQIDEKSREETLKVIQNCDQFLIKEVAAFEDVRPIIKKETLIGVNASEKSKTETEKLSDLGEENKIKMVLTDQFLKDEVERFDDVKQILPESAERKEKLKPTHLIKETIIIRGDLPDEDIKKILDENYEVGKDIIVKQDSKTDKKKSQEDISIEKSQEKKASGLLGLFGKKTKKDEKEAEEKASEEALKTIQDSDQFLETEIINFQDVRHIIEKEAPEETQINLTQTADFLKDEIDRSHDVKQILPKLPEEGPKAESAHLRKKDVVLQQEMILEKKKLKEEPKVVVEESDEKKKGGFFGLFSKKSKKDEKPLQEKSDEALKTIEHCDQFLINEVDLFEDVRPIIQKEILETSSIKSITGTTRTKSELEDQNEDAKLKKAQTTEFLKDEIERFDDVKQIFSKSLENEEDSKLKPTHIIKETIIIRGDFQDEDIKKILDDNDQIQENIVAKQVIPSDQPTPKDVLEELQQSRQTPSLEHIQNVTNTDNFLINEIKYFDDVRPIIRDVEAKAPEESPKRTKKKKKGKREGSESGDESDGSKKSGFFKLFGKKGKKDKSESKDVKVSEETAVEDKSKSSTLESPKKGPLADEKSKAERKGSQKKLKKDKTEEDSSKSLFGIFGKKDKTSSEISSQPDKIIISDATSEDMKVSSGFLTNEIEQFNDAKESKEPVIKSDVNLNGKMTIAEITKTLEPKTYESGEFQIVVSSTSEPKRREFSVNVGDKIEKPSENVIQLKEQTQVFTSEKPRIIQQEQFEYPGLLDEGRTPIVKKQALKIKKQTGPEIELSQDVLKSMIDTSNFLNQEISKFHDVRPTVREQESPLLGSEEQKDKNKRKKKQRQKSIEDDGTRKSGFFGLFGKRDKKSESPEIATDDKRKESEQIKDKISQEEPVQFTEVKPTQETRISQDIPAPIDFVESVHLTNNFLNDEIKNYHDVKPIPQTIEASSIIASQIKPSSDQKEVDQKIKSKSLFGLFGKKSEELADEQETQKEFSMKEKRERRKSGSPFRLFSKKSKEEEKIEETKPVISEQTLQDMYETKNFLSTEVMRYSDAHYRPGDKQPTEIKKSVAFLDDKVQSPALASTTTIVKESFDDGKVQIEAIFREIREDLQPAEKVIVVIKDDVSDTAKSVKEITFWPPDIISEITANIPSDSTIKEIKIETVEVDANLAEPEIVRLIRDSQESDVQTVIIGDSSKPVQATHKLEGFLDCERSFADVDVGDQTKVSVEDIGQQFQEITQDVLDLTKELDSTPDLLEDKATSVKEDLKKEAKKSARKSGGFFSKLGEKIGSKAKPIKVALEDTETQVSELVSDAKTEIKQSTEDTKKTVEEQVINVQDCAMDINDKITKDVRDFEAETSKSIDSVERELRQKEQEKIDAANQFLKNKEQTIHKIRETTPEITEIGQIVQGEIEEITRGLQGEPRQEEKLKIEIPAIQGPYLGLDISKGSIENPEEMKTEVKDVTETGKIQGTKSSKKPGRFFAKFGDKLGSKAKDIKDEGTVLAKKADDKLNQVESDTKIDDTSTFDKIDKLREKTEDKTQKIAEKLTREETNLTEDIRRVQDASKEAKDDIVDAAKEITTQIIEDSEKSISEGTRQILEDTITKSETDKIKDETQDLIENLIKDSVEQAPESKASVESREPKPTTNLPEGTAEVAKKRTKKPRKKSGGFFSKIGGIFTDKDDKVKDAHETITDKTKRTTDSISEFATETVKQTGDFLIDVKDKTSTAEKATADELKEKGAKFTDETSKTLADASEKVKDTTQAVKQTSQDLSEQAKDSIGKTKGFFSGFSKKSDDVSDQMKVLIVSGADAVEDVTNDASLKAKETAISVQETTADLAKGADNLVGELEGSLRETSKRTADQSENLKSKATYTRDSISEKVKDAGAVITDTTRKTEESVETTTSDWVKEIESLLSDTKNQTVDFSTITIPVDERISQDIGETLKDSSSKIGEFSGDLGIKTKEMKDDMMETTKHASVVAVDTTKEITESISEPTSDFFKGIETLGDQTTDLSKTTIDSLKIQKDTITEDSKEKFESVKQASDKASEKIEETVKEGTGKIAGFFGGLGKKTKDKTKKGVKSTEKATADLTKQTGDLLADLKDKSKDTSKTVSDEIRNEASEIAKKTDDIFASASVTTKDKIKSAQKSGADLSRDVQESAEKSETIFSDLTKQTNDFLTNLRDDGIEKTEDGAVKIKEEGTKIDSIISAGSKIGEDKIKSITEDVKESTAKGVTVAGDIIRDGTGKVSESIGDLGKKTAVIKDDISEKFDVVAKTGKDASKKTVKFVEDLTTKAERSTKETMDKIGESLDSFGEKIETVKDDASTKVKGVGEVFRESTKDSKESIHKTTSDLAKQTGEVLTDIKGLSEAGVNKIQVEGKQVAEEISDKLSAASETSKEATKSVKETGQLLSENFLGGLTIQPLEESASGIAKQTDDFLTDARHQVADTIRKTEDELEKKGSETRSAISDAAKKTEKDISQSTKEGVGKIGGFFSGLGKKAKDKTKKAVESTEKTSTDLAKQTGDFLVSLEGKTTDAGKKIGDKLTEGSKVSEKTSDALQSVSKAAEDKAKKVKQSGKAVTQDIKESTSDLGEKIKDIKDDMSDKIKDSTVVLTDAKKQTVEVVEKATIDVTKQTSDFLDNLREEARDTANEKTDQIKEAKSKTLDHGKKTIAAVSEVTEAKIDSVKQAGDHISEGARESIAISKGKIVDFLEDLNKKAKDAKDDTSHKIRDVGIVAADKTQQSTESLKKTATNLGTQSQDLIIDSETKVKDTCKVVTGEVKEKGKITAEAVSAVTKEKADSVKKTGKILVEDVKDLGRIGGFFDGLSTAEKVDDKVKEDAYKISEKGDGVTESEKQFGENLFEGAKDTVTERIEKLKEFFDDSKRETKHIKDDASNKAEEIKATVVGEVKQSAETVKEGSTKVVRESSDFLTDLKTEAAKTSKDVSDKIQAKEKKMDKNIGIVTTGIGPKVSSFVSDLERKTADTIECSADKAIDEGTKLTATPKDDITHSSPLNIKGEKVNVTEKPKGVKESINEASEGISGLFSGFGKRKEKKSRSVDKTPKSSVETTKQKFEHDPSDIEKFLLEERVEFVEENIHTTDKKEPDIKSKSPLVTSPTLPRRVASHRIARGDVPYFVEVTNLTYEDSSSDESYIVTEPADKFSARISDESFIDSARKRKPLFHIESEEDSVSLSYRGSIKSNVSDNSNAQRLEMLITDLDDIDDAVPTDTKFTSNVLFEANKTAKSTSDLETDIIEQKLSDIEKALGSLEEAETVEPVVMDEPSQTDKPSLKRVERKFERMASELMAESVEIAKDSNLTSPEIEEKHEQDFRKIVSQISTEEISDCQREYAALWDEQTFSPSEGCDTSKTPDSQAEVLELPQGGAYGIQERSEQQSTPQTFAKAESDESTGQRQPTDQDRAVADQHMLSDEMKKLLKELEEESKK